MEKPFLRQKEFENLFKNHLKTGSLSKSIDSLFSPRSLERINYKPEYQRNYVWDTNKASYFIESILLGTEIPPIIMFKDDSNFELIDGRQRFETIKLFINDKITLTSKGLTLYKHLTKKNFANLKKLDSRISDIFLDSKLRIFEFTFVNEPPLDDFTKDKVKKEIFLRYNSGITPLKKYEIDNAVYNSDDLTKVFKEHFRKNREDALLIYRLFLPQKEKFLKIINNDESPELFELDREVIRGIPTENVLQFVRKNLVLFHFPITYYAGSATNNLISKFYDLISDTWQGDYTVVKDFMRKVKVISTVNDTITSMGITTNRLLLETLFWGIQVLENEKQNWQKICDLELLSKMSKLILEQIHLFEITDSYHYLRVKNRYTFIGELLTKFFDFDLEIYSDKSKEFKNSLHIELRNNTADKNYLWDASNSLRYIKPEPYKNSVDDILRTMKKSKFLVRPPYQRSEVIDVKKASAIIESILLDIELPTIFVYKRSDGVSEVIDGQQRILSILGFIGETYSDENKQMQKANIDSFSLRGLRILREINNLKFAELSKNFKNKIFDFQLSIVEIDQNVNPNFNPIDLFIRLNDKPYPIKEHSFEMWNSWASKNVLSKIKKLVKKYSSWFFVRDFNGKNGQDNFSRVKNRMENEELITSLVYLDYKFRSGVDMNSLLDIYTKTDRINVRLRHKREISDILIKVSEDSEKEADFLQSIKNIDRFIVRIRAVLLDSPLVINPVEDYIRIKLDEVLKGGREKKYFNRSNQDLYLLWMLLSEINIEMLKFHRSIIQTEIKKIFTIFKKFPEGFNAEGSVKFTDLIKDFKLKFRKVERKLKLTDQQLQEKFRSQNYTCPLSGAPIYPGDDFHIDHIKPLAIGGLDVVENLQIVHNEANGKKWAKF